MKTQTKTTLRTITTALVVITVVIAFLIAGIRIFGFQIYGVTSSSMEPEYPKGSLVYVQRANVNDLRVRDVITYQLDKKTISTHRINEIVRDASNPNDIKFRTKGDANAEADNRLVTEADIIGKVAFCIPHLGNLASYIQKPPGLYVAIVVGIALVAVVVITDKETGKADDGQQVQNKKSSPFLQALLAKLGLKKKAPAQNASPLRQQGYVPGQAQPPRQQYPQGYAPQQQRYPQGYVQQQYPQGYAPQQQQYPQGYVQQQQYPQGYAQQQYPQGYAPQQQYPQGYAQQQQYPQGYAPQQQYPQGYVQQQYPQQGRQQ
ncbi:MAG: signal peptidase I [Clostridia bacterium]|nr:signal peptidase I [Clostridia bacterium]